MPVIGVCPKCRTPDIWQGKNSINTGNFYCYRISCFWHKELLPWQGSAALEQGPRDTVASPALKVFKTWLYKATSDVTQHWWYSCFKWEVRLEPFATSIPMILWAFPATSVYFWCKEFSTLKMRGHADLHGMKVYLIFKWSLNENDGHLRGTY